MKYTIKPIVSDYAVIHIDTGKIVCICNIQRNTELIADILNGDSDNTCAYSYDVYPNAKYKIVKTNSFDDTADNTDKLKEQLRKARKKAKRWKRKYLELRYKLDKAESEDET